MNKEQIEEIKTLLYGVDLALTDIKSAEKQIEENMNEVHRILNGEKSGDELFGSK